MSNINTNSINNDQNKTEYLRYRYVLRKYYSMEKSIQKFIISIVIIIYVMGLIPTIKDFKPISFIPMIWLIISLYLERKKNILHSKAIEFHEYCDRKMFELSIYEGIINHKDILYKDAISITESNNDKKNFEEMVKEEHKTSIKNWYSNISNLPLNIARIVAQDENVRWDKNQRDIYQKILYSTIGLIIIIFCCVIKFTTQNAVDILYSIPILIELLKLILDNYDSIKRGESTSKEIGKAYNYINDNGKSYDLNFINSISMDIQLRIYDNRKNSIPVPDIIYKLFRKKLQKDSSSYIETIKNDLSTSLE